MEKLKSALIMVLLLCSMVFAADTEVEAGMSPDSPFYFMDTWWDEMRVRMANTFEDKERLRLEIAEERAAEIALMASRNDEKALAKAQEQHQKQLQRIEQLNNESEQLRIQLQERMQKHIMTLGQVRENAPEEAQSGLDTAIMNANQTFNRNQERIREENREDIKEIRAKVSAGNVMIKGKLRR